MSKHVYTCPDTIHDRKVAKRNSIISLALCGVMLAASTWYAKRLEKQEDAVLIDIENPTE